MAGMSLLHLQEELGGRIDIFDEGITHFSLEYKMKVEYTSLI